MGCPERLRLALAWCRWYERTGVWPAGPPASASVDEEPDEGSEAEEGGSEQQAGDDEAAGGCQALDEDFCRAGAFHRCLHQTRTPGMPWMSLGMLSHGLPVPYLLWK